jgi:hypothetical protein
MRYVNLIVSDGDPFGIQVVLKKLLCRRFQGTSHQVSAPFAKQRAVSIYPMLWPTRCGWLRSAFIAGSSTNMVLQCYLPGRLIGLDLLRQVGRVSYLEEN